MIMLNPLFFIRTIARGPNPGGGGEFHRVAASVPVADLGETRDVALAFLGGSVSDGGCCRANAAEIVDGVGYGIGALPYSVGEFDTLG